MLGSADPEQLTPAIDQLAKRLMTVMNAKAGQLPMSNFIQTQRMC